VAVAIELSDHGHQTYAEMLQVGAEWELAVGALMVPGELARAAVAIERLYQAARTVIERDQPAPAQEASAGE
jgi:hypothetical protein